VEQTAFVSSSNPEARHALINIVKQKKDVERERERERLQRWELGEGRAL
jgi:hypothetical protein